MESSSIETISYLNKLKQDISNLLTYNREFKHLINNFHNQFDSIINKQNEQLEQISTKLYHNNIETYLNKYKSELTEKEKTITSLLRENNEIKIKYEKQLNLLETKLKQTQNENKLNLTNKNTTNFEFKIKELKEMNIYLLSQLSTFPELKENYKQIYDNMLNLQKENDFIKKQLKLSQDELLKQESSSQSPLYDKGSDENYNYSSLTPKTISPYLALYAVKRDKLVSYNFNKNQILSFEPECFGMFQEDYIEDGSITHNSLTGLFVITSSNFNVLYYFSFRNNTFYKLMTFNTNHKNGCLFLDNTYRNLFVLGGINNNKVEKLELESEDIVEFPDLNEPRSHFTCCLINDDLLYVFFGFSQSQNKCINSIEYINLQQVQKGFNLILCDDALYEIKNMSVIPYNKEHMIIVGGETKDKKYNKHLIKFNGVNNKLEIINKDAFYNKNNGQGYLFSKNSMFTRYVDNTNKNCILFCNIDDNMNSHLFDNNLNYETIIY
jgi:hypothetical protein